MIRTSIIQVYDILEKMAAKWHSSEIPGNTAGSEGRTDADAYIYA